MSKKKKKDDEVRYTLTPKGWIEIIRIYIQSEDYCGALRVCDNFDEWCDKHLVYKEK